MHNPSACFLIIGDEILSGRTREANLTVLAKLLNAQGICLKEVRIIPDQKDQIMKAVTECRAAFDYVFTSGGIGPTHDDITTAAIAEAFNLPLKRDEATFELLKKKSKDGTCNKMKEKMAWLPLNSRPIKNNISAPPGFSIGNVHVMAGVPEIFSAMAHWLIPRLPQKGAPLQMKAFHAFNLGESEFAEDFEELQEKFPTVSLGSYPFAAEGKSGVTLVAKGYDAALVAEASRHLPKIIKAHGALPYAGEFSPAEKEES